MIKNHTVDAPFVHDTVKKSTTDNGDFKIKSSRICWKTEWFPKVK